LQERFYPLAKPEELWVTNINRFQDITISDLAITVRRGQSLNLLAKKKNGLSMYNITKKQIDDSIQSGSIYKKGQHIKIRSVAPQIFTKKIEVAHVLDMGSTRTVRKPPEIEQVEFPDLDMDEGSAEDFAAENADMDAADRAPILAVDPIFKKNIDDE
jgi:hypothetical protein